MYPQIKLNLLLFLRQLDHDTSVKMFANKSPRYIIFDQDMGTDDAWALFMLLKAEQTAHVKILGITCVCGNTSLKNVVTNTIRVLELTKRTDVSYLYSISN